MKTTLFFVLAFALNKAFAQSATSTISKGRIITTDGITISFSSLMTGGVNHCYQTSSNTTWQEFPDEKTVRIEKQNESEALVWGASMGVVGVIGSLIGVSRSKNDISAWGYKENSMNTTPIVVSIRGKNDISAWGYKENSMNTTPIVVSIRGLYFSWGAYRCRSQEIHAGIFQSHV
jgi:hypothetical protein